MKENEPVLVKMGVKEWVREAENYPPLPAREQKELARIMHSGAEIINSHTELVKIIFTNEESHLAFNELVNHNLRFVFSLAKDKNLFYKCDLPNVDLLDEGVVGMIKGLAQYDVDKGYNVSTYIKYWIVREMIIAIHKANSIVIPPASFKRIEDYKKAEKLLTQELERIPKVDEVEEKLGLSRIQSDTLRAAFQASRSTKSLNEPRYKDDDPDEMFEDCIKGPDKDALAILEEKELKEFLRDVICESISLSSVDKLLYRIGLIDGKHWKYNEIGNKYGIPENKVRNNITYSLEKLRDPKSICGIWEYLDGVDLIIKT